MAFICCGMAQAGQRTINSEWLDGGLMQFIQQIPDPLSSSSRLAQTATAETEEALSFATLEGLFTIQLVGRQRQGISSTGGESIINHLVWSADGPTASHGAGLQPCLFD
jgi:hypothetical protein